MIIPVFELSIRIKKVIIEDNMILIIALVVSLIWKLSLSGIS